MVIQTKPYESYVTSEKSMSASVPVSKRHLNMQSRSMVQANNEMKHQMCQIDYIEKSLKELHLG